MRKLLLLLILLNLAFFAWQSNKPVVDTNKVPLPSSLVDMPHNKLVLLREAEELTAFSETPTPARKDTGGQQLCHTIGPFAKEEDMELAAALLGAQIVYARTRVVEEEVHAGFWVYLPEEKSISDARQVLGKLNLQGVNDSMIVQLTKDSYVISVGVFSMKSSAERRKTRMNSLGYQPTVEDRLKVKKTYWLDFDYNGDEPLAELIQRNLTDEFSGIKHQLLDCQ